jgi:hypothetical protein
VIAGGLARTGPVGISQRFVCEYGPQSSAADCASIGGTLVITHPEASGREAPSKAASSSTSNV